MQRLLTLIAVCGLSLVSRLALAAHTQVSLLLSAQEARPGDTVTASVRLRMDRGWHTYWTNSGASGEATRVIWTLPPGLTVGRIEWPLPDKLGPEDLTTYVYSGEVVLLAPLKLAADLKPGPVELKAGVTWLECEAVCIPGSNNVTARLVIGPETKPSPDAALIEAWQARVPKPAAGLSARAWWEHAAADDTRPLILEWAAKSPPAEADFFPYSFEQFEVEAHTERLSAPAGEIRLRKTVRKFQGDWPREISGVLVQTADGNRRGFEVTLPVASPGGSSGSILKMLLYAFLGGLILNIMPCVLPVIALKILGFVAQAREEPRRVRFLGVVYASGVLVSFLALAALVIGLKSAGRQAGWGMQFSSPQFVILLTVLVTLVALNLFGVFEVTVGARVMGAAGALVSRHGAAGAFFNGVLATVLATPCTAPYLSYAVGFAFTQPPAVVVGIFLTAGAGLAAPYVVLSWEPRWLRFLPKPGAWMEKFKIAMGFPMLATAIWLSSLIADNYGDRAWWLGMFLVFVAVAAWVFGTFVQRGRQHRGLALVVVVALLAVGYAWALDANLRWLSPGDEAKQTNAGVKNAPSGYAWQRWSPEAVAAARAAGDVVLVDFTAHWCITCNSIVKPALQNEKLVTELAALKAVALVADYTGFAPEITQELARHDRAGVPLVLVYPKESAAPPIVLPDPNPLLGPAHYAGLIRDALAKAAK